jgi:hypothetical protein
MKTGAKILFLVSLMVVASASATQFASQVGIIRMHGVTEPYIITNYSGEVLPLGNVTGSQWVTNRDAQPRLYVVVDGQRAFVQNFENRNGQYVITDSAADIQYKKDFQAVYLRAQQITAESNWSYQLQSWRLPSIRELVWNRNSGLAVFAAFILGIIFRDPCKEFGDVLSKIGLTACMAIALVQLVVLAPKPLTFPGLAWQIYASAGVGILLVLMWRKDVMNKVRLALL